MQPQKPLPAFREDNEKEFKTGKLSQEAEQGKNGLGLNIWMFNETPLETNPASRDFSSETNKIPLWVKPD